MTAADDLLLGRLGADWNTVAGRAWEYLERAEADVVERRWLPMMAGVEAPWPLWFERDGREAPTRRYKAPGQYRIEYGYTADGRVLVSKDVDGARRLKQATVWVTGSDGERLQLYLHDDGGDRFRILRLAAPTYRDGQLAELRTFGEPAERAVERRERYDRDERGRITRIHEDRSEHGDPLAPKVRYDVDYDDRDKVAEIRATKNDGSVRVVYRQRDRVAEQRARELVDEQLIERAAAWARRVAPAAPVDRFALMYSLDDPTLPPALALGAGEGDLPAEFALVDGDPAEFHDDAFLDACRTLNQRWASADTDTEPRRTLMRAAKRLAGEQLGIRKAPGFLVYAVDDEIEDLERNLAAARR